MDSTNRRIIFITGASRSGTTLLSFVLGNHSKIFGLNELHFFGKAWDPRAGAKVFSRAAAIEAAASIFACQERGILLGQIAGCHRQEATLLVDELGTEAFCPEKLFSVTVLRLAERNGKTIPCEQTPRNIFYMSALLDVFPDAHVIHMVRDPRAVMASQKKRWQRRRLSDNRMSVPLYETIRSWINYHPYTMARLWLKATDEAVRCSNHPRVKLVRYEDLVQAPEKTVKSICGHLGIDYSEKMLDVKQHNSSHQSSQGGARKGLHADAIGKWRVILSPVEAAIVERYCAALMQRFGYTTEGLRSSWMSLGEVWYCLSYLPHLMGVLMINPRRAWIQAWALRERRGYSRFGSD